MEEFIITKGLRYATCSCGELNVDFATDKDPSLKMQEHAESHGKTGATVIIRDVWEDA